MFRINKTINEFYRAGFIPTAISEGIYDMLSQGPASCKDIQNAIGSDSNPDGLKAWLDLGVSLGELVKNKEGCSIKSKFSLIYYFPVEERIDLLRHLGSFTKPEGKLILTTLCPVNEPSIQLMNLWTSMTDGCGALPYPEQVCDQIKEAGFDKVQFEKLYGDILNCSTRL